MLIEQVVQRENLMRAYNKVVQNKGAPGVDDVRVDQLMDYCRQHWSRIRQEILDRQYTPAPVKRVDIPKPGGKGTRMLGIPCVIDRLIQQALLQVLQPLFEPLFSPHSFGFRPLRSAHQAVSQARDYVASGLRYVVDIDLEKFFDRVNHDILMARVARKVEDKGVLKLIRSYLTAGIMVGGIVSSRSEGTPQGGPLSPLLSNILLTDLDNELMHRGLRFCRYADDCNIYVGSRAAGERVLASVTRFLETKLKLKVNSEKSAVAYPWERKFLGYSMIEHRKQLLLTPAPQSIDRLKEKLRPILRSAKGRNIPRQLMYMRPIILGWAAYYRLCEVKICFKDIDKWLRHHIRNRLWRQWKTPKKRAKELVRLGIDANTARKASTTGCGPWWCSKNYPVQRGLSNAALRKIGYTSVLDTIERLRKSA